MIGTKRWSNFRSELSLEFETLEMELKKFWEFRVALIKLNILHSNISNK